MRVPSGCSKLETTTIIDKVKGLIFGSILGDSLGLATAGLSIEEIQRIYNKGSVRFGMDEDGTPFYRDEFRSKFDENDFGYNTEQVLVLMESLIETNGYFSPKTFASIFLDYHQHGIKKLNKLPVNINEISDVVLSNPLYKKSPQEAAIHVWKENQHKTTTKGANGALARAPLLGALKFWDGTTVIENTTACCRVTHPDPRCMISCVIISSLVARLLRGQDLEIQVNHSPTPSNNNNDTSFLSSLSTHDQLEALVRNVIETNKSILIAPQSDSLFLMPDTITKEQLQSYYKDLVNSCLPTMFSSSSSSYSSLCKALYCFTRYVPPQSETDYFKRILFDVILEGGDADTNGALVGAMLGARFGYSQLPTEWVVGLKRWEWLEDKVDEFCSLLY